MRFLKRSIVQRVAGTCITDKPKNNSCWRVKGGVIEVNIDKAPELAAPSGALRLEGKGLERRVLIVHGEDGEFYAFPNHCTHMGRRMDPMPGDPLIQCCSLGKSTFDYAGKVVYGDDTTDLQMLPITRENGVLRVQIG